MQENKKIRLPSCLANRLQQCQSNNEVSYYLTIFSIKQPQNECSYIIDIGQQKSAFPICLQPTLQFYQMEQKISKQNKKSVISKYPICDNEEVNTKMQKYLIYNFLVSAIWDLQTQIIGYKVTKYTKQPNKNAKQSNYAKFQDILSFCTGEAKDIWSQFNSCYCRTLKDKKQKQFMNTTNSIIPMLQFQITPIMVPVFGNKVQNNIGKYGICNTYWPVIFRIQEQQSQQKQKIKRLDLFLAEKTKLKQQSSLVKCQLFSCPRANPKKIFNPHIFAKHTLKQKYELILAKGVYEYYHYGDQGFTDNGWGCAYRALQTLISWLNIQGHTEPMSTMMNIIQIQERIDQFDRSRKLKGSSAWIGATQISWIVPTITIAQINCKILHVSDGKKILEKCQELKNHFLTSGCPIMYGGGEYAYSIVGMHYNWKLGQCDFLILDPHYTGQDDYGKIIQKKGLVWRKPDQMFKKGVFYNFCLPIIK